MEITQVSRLVQLTNQRHGPFGTIDQSETWTVWYN